MKEIITILVGQAGVQVGDATWGQYCLEHEVDSNIPNNIDSSFKTVFHESESGKFTPRSIFIDLEPSILNRIKKGARKSLYDPTCFINATEDTGGNFARGYYSAGRKLVDECISRIRVEADKCNDLQGFKIIHSVGGGTGSGFTSLLSERISVDYAKKDKLSFVVYPSSTFVSSPMEAYNATLASSKMLYSIDVSVLFENNAIYNILKPKLEVNPSISNLNTLISQTISSITSPMRFKPTKDTINNNINELKSNLNPYPLMHFLIPSFSPLSPLSSNSNHNNQNISQIVDDLFESSNFMVNGDQDSKDRHIATSMMLRGNVTYDEVDKSFKNVKEKRSSEFFSESALDCCDAKCTFGVNNQSQENFPVTGVMVANTTRVSCVFKHLGENFDKLWSKRSFSHWYYSEGMEEGDMIEAREDLKSMEQHFCPC